MSGLSVASDTTGSSSSSGQRLFEVGFDARNELRGDTTEQRLFSSYRELACEARIRSPSNSSPHDDPSVCYIGEGIEVSVATSGPSDRTASFRAY